MAIRVDNVSVTMDVYAEFGGHSTITFAYAPESCDPLAAALVAKHRELSFAAALGAGPAIGLLG